MYIGGKIVISLKYFSDYSGNLTKDNKARLLSSC